MPPKKKPVQKEVKDAEHVAAEAALVSVENKDAPIGITNKEIDYPAVEDVPKPQKKAAAKKQKKPVDILQPTSKGSEEGEKVLSDAPVASVGSSGEKNRDEVDNPVEEVLPKPTKKAPAKKQKKPVNDPKASKDGLDDKPGVDTVKDTTQEELDKENVEDLKPDDKPAKKTEKSSPRRGVKRGPNKAHAAPFKSTKEASEDKEVAELGSVEETLKTDEEPVKKTEKAPPRRGARRGVQKVDDAPSIPPSGISEDEVSDESPVESVNKEANIGDKIDEEPLKKKEKLPSRRGAKRGQKAEGAPPSATTVDASGEMDKDNAESHLEEGDSKDVEKAPSRRGVKRVAQKAEDAPSNPVSEKDGDSSKPRGGGRKDVQVAKEVEPEHDVGGDDEANGSNEPVHEGKGAGKKRGGRAKEDKGGKKNEAEPDEKKAKVEEETTYECEKTNKKGEKWNLKISTWNVAGLRAWIKKNGVDYVKEEDPDIICLQETKCPENKVPPESRVEGYHTFWASGSKDGYAGVALFSKEKPLNVTYGVNIEEHDKEGRVITAEYEKFYLVTTYVPNAGQGLKTLPKRLGWDIMFRKYLKDLDAKKPVILCGDLNVAHEEIDLANPKTNTKSAGFTKEERENMTALLKEGFVDSFRQLYPGKTGCYTYWTYIGNARSRNTGWRLDYFVLSERLMDSVCDVVMRNKVLGSDHCPITLFIHI